MSDSEAQELRRLAEHEDRYALIVAAILPDLANKARAAAERYRKLASQQKEFA